MFFAPCTIHKFNGDSTTRMSVVLASDVLKSILLSRILKSTNALDLSTVLAPIFVDTCSVTSRLYDKRCEISN